MFLYSSPEGLSCLNCSAKVCDYFTSFLALQALSRFGFRYLQKRAGTSISEPARRSSGVPVSCSVLRNKRNHSLMKTAANRTLAWIAIGASTTIVAYALLVSPATKILLLALSPIGFLSGRSILRFISTEPTSPHAWFYEHLGAMIGAGIAFHTAFFVFGSTRLFDIGLTGWVAAIPWLTPSAIGIPASLLLTSHYRRKFGDFARA